MIQAVEAIPTLIFAFSANVGGQNFTYSAYMVLWLIGRTAIGLVVLLFAPAIAARFYPTMDSTETTHLDDETKPLKIGIQLLAIYALLLAVQAAARVIPGILSGNNVESGHLTNLLTFGLNLAFAAILLLGKERIVTFIDKVRYVPERDAYEPPPLNE